MEHRQPKHIDEPPNRQLGDSLSALAPRQTKASGTGTLGKALEVLDLIAMSETPLRFTDILNQLDQPRGTLHRQISNLVEEGFVVVNTDHSYSAGYRLLRLAARSWSKNSFRSIAEPHIRTLQEQAGETVHLGVMNDLEVIYVDKLESRQNVRMHSQVGNVSPLYCTGIGKAMLALLPINEAKARADRMSFVQHTPTTLHTPALLLKELEEIRRSGLAYDREEHEPGIRCVARGFEAPEAKIIAGVSVTAPAYRMSDQKVEELEYLVTKTAKAIEVDVAAGLGPRSQE